MIDSKLGRVTYNHVIGYAHDGQGGFVVKPASVPMGDASQNLKVDTSIPVTLARCRELLAEARRISGRELYQIKISDSEWSVTPGNEHDDWAETCYRDKEFVYVSATNCLTIASRGKVIYINDNGSVLRGDDAAVAHADSLDI